jgi:hypothetical protein
MAQAVAGPEIERLIQLLARLPGLGPRSARRAALHLIAARAASRAVERGHACRERAHPRLRHCGNVDTSDPCTICRDAGRDGSILVVVEGVSDLWALERAGAIRAKYHVLGGVLSALDGVRPEHLNVDALVTARIRPDVGRSSWRSTRRSTGRRPRITSPISSGTCPRASPAWRMASRSAASSTISTRARSRPPCGSGPPSEVTAGYAGLTPFPPRPICPAWPSAPSSFCPTGSCASCPSPSGRSRRR